MCRRILFYFCVLSFLIILSESNEDKDNNPFSKLPYGEYAYQISQVMLRDVEYREAMNKPFTKEDIESGKVAENLNSVSIDNRKKLDDIKKKEIVRLQLNGNLSPKYLDITIEEFGVSDFDRLLKQTDIDLDELSRINKKKSEEDLDTNPFEGLEYADYAFEIAKTISHDENYKKNAKKTFTEDEIESGGFAENFNFLSVNTRKELHSIKYREVEKIAKILNLKLETEKNLETREDLPKYLDMSGGTFSIKDFDRLIRNSRKDLKILREKEEL